mgnify:CR=1 FL=1
MSKKVMIVDDDPTIVRLVRNILESGGYEVAEAVDGLDALAKIKSAAPDVIVLDIVMPEINGYDVCCELRFNKDYAKIPIVILSETDREIDDVLGERVNIEYLSKKDDLTLIIGKIEKLLSE